MDHYPTIDECKEKDSIVSYRDSNGVDYYAIQLLPGEEDYWARRGEEVGLDTLCEQFPYQRMVVHPKTKMLVAADPNCEYCARLTNNFHIARAVKRDAALEAASTSVFQPYTNEMCTNAQYNRSDSEIDNSCEQIHDCGKEWRNAYHFEKETPIIHETNFEKNLETQDDRNEMYKYGIADNAVGENLINVDWNDIPTYHPNTQRATPYYPQQPYAYQPYAVYPQPMNQMGMQQPPYNTSYLPAYRSNTQFPYIDQNKRYSQFEMFEDAARKAAERDEANLRYVTAINQYVRKSNPTLLDTESDYSSAEYVARVQNAYSNPYYNNLNSNGQYVQQGQIINPLYQRQAIPVYNNYGYNGYGGYNSCNNFASVTNLDFMKYTDEEIEAGIGFKVSLIRVKEGEEPPEPEYEIEPYPQKVEIKARVVRMYTVVDDDGNEIELEKEAYDKYLKEKEVKEAEFRRLDAILTKLDRVSHRSSRYSERYIKGIVKLAEQLAVYDEARSLCLLGSLDDEDFSRENFYLYYRACKDKLKWYQDQEKANPNLDYREPYRYRQLPKLTRDPKTNELRYVPYNIPRKRTFNMGHNRVIPFYEYDRGSDPSIEEWKLFYARAEYEREIEIQLSKVSLLEEELNEEEELAKYNGWSYFDQQMRAIKAAEIERKKKYRFYRVTLGTTLTDEEFDQWWNKNSPKAQQPQQVATPEGVLKQRSEYRRQMNRQHFRIIDSITTPNQEEICRRNNAKLNQMYRDFEQGIMDDCTDLKGFFDRLGFLMVRLDEEKLERQRRARFDTSLNIDREAYRQEIFRHGNMKTHDLSNVEHPHWAQKPTYTDFINCEQYAKNKERFLNYCANTKGHIPLRPIFM